MKKRTFEVRIHWENLSEHIRGFITTVIRTNAADFNMAHSIAIIAAKRTTAHLLACGESISHITAYEVKP